MATYAQKQARLGPSPAAAGIAQPLTRVAIEVPLAPLAQASTDFVVPIPRGARNVTFKTITDTAFTAATDATIAIGSAAGGAQYVAATTIKAVGVKLHTPVDAAAASYNDFPADVAYVRIAQTGSTTAVGAAKLYVDYSLPA